MTHTPGPWKIDDDPTKSGVFVENDGYHGVSAGDGCSENGFSLTGFFSIEDVRLIAAAPELLAALKATISIADEAREEWDKAPSNMRAGKLLIALSGHLKGYRPDIDSIHATIAKAEGHQS